MSCADIDQSTCLHCKGKIEMEKAATRLKDLSNNVLRYNTMDESEDEIFDNGVSGKSEKFKMI